MPQQRIFTTTTVAPYNFDIRHNLTMKEFTAVFHKWELTSPTHSQASLLHLINHYTDKCWSAHDPADPYWGIPAYSNSRLGSIKNQLQGKTDRPSRSVFVFGTALHELLLQPETIADARDYYLSPSKLLTLYRMRDALAADETVQFLLQNSLIESVSTWTDPTTGLPCKGKIDLRVEPNQGRERLVADIKTTSATTLQEFELSITRYDYLRQGAFYADGTDAKDVYFIGVGKQKPHPVFIVAIPVDTPQIEAARARYKFILQKALQLRIAPL